MIILNGLGCTVSGGRLILQELINSFPKDSKLHVIAPSIDGFERLTAGSNVKTIYLSHKVWKGILRLIPELTINILLILNIAKRCINISNYGLCYSKNQILYIHNQYLLDLSLNNTELTFKRKMLNTYIARGKFICIQTEYMKNELKSYISTLNKWKLNDVIIEKLAPLPTKNFGNPDYRYEKNFEFEFFYPASTFIHKQTELAISSIQGKNGIGLSITVDNLSNRKSESINYLGVITYDKVTSIFSRIDALLFTSTRESLGLPLLEALDFELPAVLPNLEYAKEIYGDAAVYFKENTKDSISEAIDILVYNYDHYKENAVLRKKSEWSSRISWSQHWDIFLK